MKSQPRFLKGLLFSTFFFLKKMFYKEKMPKKRNTKNKKEQKARFNMVLFEQSHVRTRTGGMDRRKEREPYAHPSCYAQRTRLDVHRTLARVPSLCQNIADDNDTDARGRDHETIWEHMPRDGGAVHAGNARPKAQDSRLPRRPRQRSNVPCP